MNAPVESLEVAYDAWHEAVAERAIDAPTAPWHRLAIAALEREMLAGRSVLEVACGRGGFSAWLSECAGRVVAADFSESAVRIAAGHLARFPSCEVRREDLQALSFPDNSFDVVVSLETLEHLPDPVRGMTELVRVARPGGLLVVTGPNYLSTAGIHRLYVTATGREYKEAGQPINKWLFLPVQARRLRRLGCDVVAVRGVGHYLPFPGRRAFRFPWLDWSSGPQKWLALHGLVVARKRTGGGAG